MDEILEMQDSFQNASIQNSVKIKKKSLFAQRSEKLKFVQSVTSQSTLFEGVLSDVVEKDFVQVNGSERSFQKQGFPSVSHRSVNIGKFGVKQTTKDTKKATQSNDPELQKLKWTFPDDLDKPAPNLDHLDIRFNFSGEIMGEENEENDHGLYHHGEEYYKPGYTIAELLHLSKSTVSAQRVLALQSLTNIMRNLHDDKYSDKSVEIINTCREQNLLLSARIGLDSYHSTVVDQSLNLIATSICCSELYLSLYDSLFNNINGKRILALEKNSLLAFVQDPTKFDDEIDAASMKGIMDALSLDSLLGLLMTQIIPRIRFLLGDELASIERKVQLIQILSKLALHSASSCEDIMACEGLVDILHKEIFQINWPINEQNSKLEYLKCLLRLIRLLCQSSKDAAVAFYKLGIFQSLMRFVSVLSFENKAIFPMQFQIFSLLNVCLSYGIGESILDEFHVTLFENGEFLLNSVSSTISRSSDLIEATVSWFNFLNDALLLFRNNLNPGGMDDAFLPFVDISSKILSYTNSSVDWFEISSASLRFITTYMVLSDFELLNMNSKVFGALIVEHLPTVVANSPKMTTLVPVESILTEAGVGVLQRLRLKYAFELQTMNKQFDLFSSICQALNFCIRKRIISKNYLTELVAEAKFDAMIKLVFNLTPHRKDWLSSFAHGMLYFSNDYLSMSEIAYSLDCSKLISTEEVTRLSWLMINFLLPGDEWILQQCLKRLNLHQDTFLKSIFTIDVLTLSKGLYLPSPSNPTPSSFLMDSKSITILPLREFWCYDFPVTLRDNSATCTIADLTSWLRFIEVISINQYDEFQSYHLFSLLNVFLLKDVEGDYHFLEPAISSIIEKIVRRIANYGKNLSDCQRLYPLYLELLDHYQAVSYGDAVFGKCLLFLCQLSFPFDFRLAFWSKMQLYLNHFQFDCADVIGNIRNYVNSNADNEDVEIQKLIAKNSGRVAISNSALWTILQ